LGKQFCKGKKTAKEGQYTRHSPITKMRRFARGPGSSAVDALKSTCLRSNGIYTLHPSSIACSGELLCSNVSYKNDDVCKSEAKQKPYIAKSPTSENVIQVLLKRQNDAKIALHYFYWVEREMGFVHGIESYCVIIHILVRAKKYAKARSLLEFVLAKEGNRGAVVVFDNLMKTYTLCNSVVDVFDLLLIAYGSSGMVRDGVQSFRQMVIHGIVPSTLSRNVLLNAVAKSDLMFLTGEIFREMRGKGMALDCYGYSIMIHCCFRDRKLGDAVVVFDEICGKGRDRHLCLVLQF
jgi:pentatricopeptide repeat protein